jgi:hypothetical protein
VAQVDRRSRLPDAIDALLRVPVFTPKALGSQAPSRAADRDGAAQGVTTGWIGAGGYWQGEFSSLRDLRRLVRHTTLPIPPKRSRMNHAGVVTARGMPSPRPIASLPARQPFR